MKCDLSLVEVWPNKMQAVSKVRILFTKINLPGTSTTILIPCQKHHCCGVEVHEILLGGETFLFLSVRLNCITQPERINDFNCPVEFA